MSEMPFTSLVLGSNWIIGEWPESVDVMHEGSGDSIKYVPERTCTLKEDFTEPMTLKRVMEYECSECGGLTNAQILDESDVPRYCANCGAKVIWR